MYQIYRREVNSSPGLRNLESGYGVDINSELSSFQQPTVKEVQMKSREEALLCILSKK